MPPRDIHALIDALIGDDGEIAYTDFMGQMISAKRGQDESLLWQIFQDVDQDDSGSLDHQELELLLQRPALQQLLGDRTAAELLRDLDEDQSGHVSFEEFCRACEREPKD